MNLYATFEIWGIALKGVPGPILVSDIPSKIAELKKHQTLTFWF